MFTSFTAWREKRSIRRTRQELSQLSDQILNDIGLTRADIALLGMADGPVQARLKR
jgi:hypothetical protein